MQGFGGISDKNGNYQNEFDLHFLKSQHSFPLIATIMKFFAVAALALASVAVAAPAPEGQTTSIKLSKDYVDAIIAAYPDVHKRDCSFDFSCGCIFCT
ncbi:hypothetical protein CGLO_08137 [Colletotrichum gloeosporioides Cg-14]|uniref:Uncharacterized protein n=2 Tax=Colletotrichum gloeosporioides TaxID=474922 RepID=T0LKS8_COLGC|nr:hypothetical protein CGLO_08137 [Colletotrichum gloeosporioides Cg-14]